MCISNRYGESYDKHGVEKHDVMSGKAIEIARKYEKFAPVTSNFWLRVNKLYQKLPNKVGIVNMADIDAYYRGNTTEADKCVFLLF